MYRSFVVVFSGIENDILFWPEDSLTWSIPHWGWHMSCFRPYSCLAALSGFPLCLPTYRKWSSWWTWCFCPAGCMSLFQSEINTRQLGEASRELLWDTTYCPLRFTLWIGVKRWMWVRSGRKRPGRYSVQCSVASLETSSTCIC